MPRTKRTWRLVASALALLMAGKLVPQVALAQTAGATQSALTPPKVSKFVTAKRPESTPAEGAAVDLELTIAADGKLTEAKVVASAGEDIDAAAVEAVKSFEFEPARRGDRAVPARIRYRYTPVELLPGQKDPAGGTNAPGALVEDMNLATDQCAVLRPWQAP